MRKALLLLLPFVLTGCLQHIGETLRSGEIPGLSGDSGRWAGPVVPTEANCGSQTTGLMSLSGKKFSFDPFGSITVIQGTVEQYRLEGTASRQVAGQSNITIRFTATVQHPADGPSVIAGTLASGRCAWTVALRRQ